MDNGGAQWLQDDGYSVYYCLYRFKCMFVMGETEGRDGEAAFCVSVLRRLMTDRGTVL